MSSKYEIAILPDGTFVRRDIEERELNVTDAILNTLGETSPRKLGSLFALPGYGNVSGVLVNNLIYAWLKMPRIILRCPFGYSADVLVPKFSSITEPVLTIEWAPHSSIADTMTPMIMMRCGNNSDGSYTDRVWLWAKDNRNAQWKMPLANTHDDCQLCTGGDGATYGITIQEAMLCMLERIDNARWNNDLLPGEERTNAMFRFKPLNDKFEVLPPANANWQQYCVKVSNAFIGYAL